jgi:hypothetical protein
LSLLYIVETRKRLKDTAILHHNDRSREVFWHLIYVNVLIIVLDCSNLAISYANFFYVQRAYKPCVYGIKLRIEFSILNRLITSVKCASDPSFRHENCNGNVQNTDNTLQAEPFGLPSMKSDAQMHTEIPDTRHNSTLDIASTREEREVNFTGETVQLES